MKKIDSKISNKRLTSVAVMVLATCFVIGLLSSTAIKLASATLYMKNSTIKTTNSTIAGIAQDLGLPVEPVQPSEGTPVISIGDATDNAGNTASGTTDNKVEDTTGAATDNKTDTSTDDTTDASTPSDSTGSSASTDSSDSSGSTDSSDSNTSDDSSSSSILDSIMGILGSLGVGGSGGTGEPDTPVEEEQEPGSTKVDITNEEALKSYNAVVNSTKVKMPAFVKTTSRTADFIATLIVKMNPEYFVKDQVVEVPGKTVNTDLCIDNNKVSACLLTSADADAVKSASKEVLADGNVKLVITLNDEENPVPLEENAISSDSYTSAMFPVTTADKVKAMVDGALGSDVSDTSLLYKNCTVSLVYNPKTGEIVSLKQTTSYTASMQTSLFPLEFTVTEVTNYTDFVY